MAVLLLALGLIACSCAGSGAVRTIPDSETSYPAAIRVTVLVASGDVVCGGVRVPEGILTAAHCTHGPATEVGGADEILRPADVLRVDEDRDLALLSDPLSSDPGATVRDADLPLGAHVLIVGHPGGLRWTVHEGYVSSTRRYRGHWQQIRAGVIQGFSGGPVIDDDGRVGGVVSRMATLPDAIGTPQPIHDIGFAAPVAEIRMFLAGR